MCVAMVSVCASYKLGFLLNFTNRVGRVIVSNQANKYFIVYFGNFIVWCFAVGINVSDSVGRRVCLSDSNQRFTRNS